MMVSSPILSSSKERPFLFERFVPVQYKKDFFQHLVDKKNLYIVIIAGEANQVFITQETPNSPGICYVFWRKSDAYVYASSNGLSKDQARIWEVTFEDVLGFAKKMHKDENSKKTFDVIAGIFHEGYLLDVDLIWSKNNQNMV